jgi:hypothetical protein
MTKQNEKSNGQLLVEGGAFKDDDSDLFEFLEQKEDSMQGMRVERI